MPFKLIDTTLRDGEQAPGIVFDYKDKYKIATLLDQLGIEEVEIGTPALGLQEINDIRKLISCNFNFRTLVWSRALAKDIIEASKTKADGINISFPVSEIQLNALEKDYHWIRSDLPFLIQLAKDHFEFVAVGAQDASRAAPDFLDEYIGICKENEADRVRIADTVGILNPIRTHKLMLHIKEKFPLMTFEFHGHNDLGMATGNSLSAILAGTDAVSVTVNGLGERAGNTALEELIMASIVSAGFEPVYHLEKLNHLCTLVSQLSNRPIPVNKSITGILAFKHESGIHCNSLSKNKLTYQPFDNTSIGNENYEICIGKHSGKASIKQFFKNKKIKISDEECNLILYQVKQLSCSTKGLVSAPQLIELYRKLSKSRNLITIQ